MSDKPAPSLVWPAHPADPEASTSLRVGDLTAAGGAAALRRYLIDRFHSVEAAEPGTPKLWVQSMLDYVHDEVGNQTDDGVDLAAAAVHLLLAYVEWLEEARHG